MIQYLVKIGAPLLMVFRIDFRSEQPIYIQIVEGVSQMIASGELKPGDQLPTVRQMATDLRVNFNTVARAYRLLDETGLISTQHGRGTYIWDTPSEETSQRLRLKSLDEMTTRFVQEASRLGFSPLEIRKKVKQQLKTLSDEDDEQVNSSQSIM